MTTVLLVDDRRPRSAPVDVSSAVAEDVDDRAALRDVSHRTTNRRGDHR
jgi:hypothetical protein